MIILKDKLFQKQLFCILKYIANDKISEATKFEKNLNNSINNLVDFPYKYRVSHYLNNKFYRDMIFNGYTIIYKVEAEKILILEIFKWQER